MENNNSSRKRKAQEAIPNERDASRVRENNQPLMGPIGRPSILLALTKLAEEKLLAEGKFWDINLGTRLRLVMLGSSQSGKTSAIESLLGVEKPQEVGSRSGNVLLIRNVRNTPQKNLLFYVEGEKQGTADYLKVRQSVEHSEPFQVPCYGDVTSVDMTSHTPFPLDLMDTPTPRFDNWAKEWLDLTNKESAKEEVCVAIAVPLDNKNLEYNAVLGEVYRRFILKMDKLSLIIVFTKIDLYVSKTAGKGSGSVDDIALLEQMDRVKKLFGRARIFFAFMENGTHPEDSQDNRNKEKASLSRLPRNLGDLDYTILGTHELRRHLLRETIRIQDRELLKDLVSDCERDLCKKKEAFEALDLGIEAHKMVDTAIKGIDLGTKLVDLWEREIYEAFREELQYKDASQFAENDRTSWDSLMTTILENLSADAESIIETCINVQGAALEENKHALVERGIPLLGYVMEIFCEYSAETLSFMVDYTQDRMGEMIQPCWVNIDKARKSWKDVEPQDSEGNTLDRLCNAYFPDIARAICSELIRNLIHGFRSRLYGRMVAEKRILKGGTPEQIERAKKEYDAAKEIYDCASLIMSVHEKK